MSEIGNVLYPVPEIGKAVAFYAGALGLSVKFQDGERYAALDGGRTTLALAGPGEDVTGGRPAASFKVADVARAVADLERAGAAVVSGADEGPHEIRAVLSDPWGNPIVIYSPR